jgi:hypothetical protein
MRHERPREIDRAANMGNNNRNYMRLFNGHALRFLQFSLLAASMFFCGCATTTNQNLFTVSGPGWRVQQGQVLWTPQHGAPQFGGDLVLATDSNGQALIQFDKTPLAIVAAQVTPQQWQIRDPLFGYFWKGHEPASTRFVWLYLPDALAGKPLPKSLHFEQKPDGNWQLENDKTGEILEGFLSP